MIYEIMSRNQDYEKVVKICHYFNLEILHSCYDNLIPTAHQENGE